MIQRFFKIPKTILQTILQVIWRIWCYSSITFIWLCCFPFWLLFSLKEKWYPWFYQLGRVWAMLSLYCCGFFPKKLNANPLQKNQPFIYIANHTSLLDTLVMLYYVKTPCVFVGKKSLSKIPIFGLLFKRVCIMVDRSCAESRRSIIPSVNEKLRKGVGVCIFPEGRIITDTDLGAFKKGAFQMSIETQTPIQPILFLNHLEHFSYTFLSGKPGILYAYFLKEQFPKEQETPKIYSKRVEDFFLEKLRELNNKYKSSF